MHIGHKGYDTLDFFAHVPVDLSIASSQFSGKDGET
jgi:hypothetical protein